MSHLYVLVRADLTPEQQTVQAAHAAIEAARRLPDGEAHPHLVLCTVRDLRRLEIAAERLADLPCYPFHEPDLGGTITAVAIGPLRGEARRRLAKFNLMRSTS